MTRGKFITLEGGEGVGKSTNLNFIKGYLQDHGIAVITTREPGGTQLAEKIRLLLLDAGDENISESTELLLMFAARSQHIGQVIEPALAQGKWVVCDRFTDATYAYQGGGRNMEISTIKWLENLVQDSLSPDLTLLLDAPVEIGIERVRERGKLDRFESEKIDFFERVRQAYLRRAELYPDRIKLIKANRPLNDVQRALVDVLRQLIT
ncbi:dTMP kinase [Methylobacter marinus]|jgi:dTMP kinase|uniref:dTMP kinase n=1 Tax=Methylobacter marinus TaxID=34058 RepID=UPI000374248F|nr:dTMP kinase [Methylobacter marinus]